MEDEGAFHEALAWGYAFDLAAYDRWLSQLPEGADKESIAEARQEALAAFREGHEAWLRRCVLSMLWANRLWHVVPGAIGKAQAVKASQNNLVKARRMRPTAHPHTEDEAAVWRARDAELMVSDPTMSERERAGRIASEQARASPLEWAETIRRVIRRSRKKTSQ